MNKRSVASLQKATIPTFTLMPTNFLQRKCACGQHTVAGGECGECRQKRERMMQRAAVSPAPVNSVPLIVHDVLRSPGQPLDAGTRAFMEPRFGYDFSQVQVHTDARAAESARAVNALAYTVGRDVVFGTGQYAPETREGRRLLAHELTHVVQQAVTNTSVSGTQLTMSTLSQDSLEGEAVRNVQNIDAGHAVSVSSASLKSLLMRQPQRKHSQSNVKSTQELTKRQLTRDNFLRNLAASPDAALRYWRRLRPGEQTIVVTYMAIFYGLTFARRFLAGASSRSHPETVITITNVPGLTPAQLEARGYRRAGGDDNIQFWVHPSGNEIWILSPSKKPTTEVQGERSETQDPIVMEAHGQADAFTAARDRLIKQLAELKSKIGTPEYAQLYQQYWKAFTDWQEALNPIIDEKLAEWESEVEPEMQAKLKEQIDRLKGLIRWKQEEWPQSVRDLPPP